MFEYRPYIIAIAAIFLALAAGILIGITFGDNVVVTNQKEMIELMQGQLTALQEDLTSRQRELKRWQSLAPQVMKSYEGSLAEEKILILTAANSPAEGLLPLLIKSGAETGLVEFPERFRREPGPDPQTVHAVAGRLTGELAAAAQAGEEGVYTVQGEITGCPHFFLLYFNPGEPPPGQLWLQLLGEELLAAGKQVIAVFPEEEAEDGRKDGKEPSGPALPRVEHLDTFWGQLALLEMLLEKTSAACREGAGS